MAKPMTVHTVESLQARCDLVGDCWEWTGFSQTRSPVVFHNGKMVTVRRLMLTLQQREPTKPNSFASTTCGNVKCVNPEHIIVRSSKQHAKHMQQRINYESPTRTAKIQKAKAHMRLLSEEAVNDIRISGAKIKDLAQKYGCSVATIKKAKAGVSYKPVSSVWRGLL